MADIRTFTGGFEPLISRHRFVLASQDAPRAFVVLGMLTRATLIEAYLRGVRRRKLHETGSAALRDGTE